MARGPKRITPTRSVGAAGNIGSTFTGYGVGIPSFLNDAEDRVGRYWRFIEFGSNGFTDKLMGGLWGSSRSAGTLYPFGEGVGQQFVPFGKQGRTGDVHEAENAAYAALRYLYAQGGASKQRFSGNSVFASAKYTPSQVFRILAKNIYEGIPGPTLGMVNEEYAGMHAYREAAAAFGPGEREAEVVGRLLPIALAQAAGGRSPTVRENRPFLAHRGLLAGFVLSQRSRDIGNVVDQQLRRQLTQANRELAAELAAVVAARIEQSLYRPRVSTGKLAEAAEAPGNRFPL